MTDTCPVLHDTLTPTCDIDFKIYTRFSGTEINNGIISPASADYTLGICNNTVVFTNIECDAKSLGSVIMAIPLKFVKDCQLYMLDLQTILSSPNNHLRVTEVNTGNVLLLDLQVANGYLYVEINVTDTNNNSLLIFDGVTAPSLELCFTRFSLPLRQKYVGCRCPVPCLPLTWLCGRQLEVPAPVVP